MEKLMQMTSKGASLILDNPQSEDEARRQVVEKTLRAFNRLYDYESTGLTPGDVKIQFSKSEDEIRAGIKGLVRMAYKQGLDDGKSGDLVFDDGFDADVSQYISGILTEKVSDDAPPASWQAFVSRQTDIHVQKDTDYGSRYMRGLIEHGKGIFRWEVEKKLDRIRNWLQRGELLVQGEGLNNAVGDLFNYTVQFIIWREAQLTDSDPLESLSAGDFFTNAINLQPEDWVSLLEDVGLIEHTEAALKATIVKYMGGGK